MGFMASFKQLRYFEAVARLGHFGKAAEHCAVTQPALSMQIQELERELGVRLVNRRPKGAVLTEAGREIARRASRILTEVRDLKDCARQVGRPLAGPLNLGIIPTVAPYVLPPLLPSLRQHYAELELRVRETHTAHLKEALLEGSLDLLLLALPLEHADIETLPLFEDRFLLALPASRRVKSGMRATPDLLEKDRLLLLEEGHCLRDQALAYCRLRRVDSIDTFGVSGLSTIVQMVANGMGLTLLPEISIDVETMHGQVRLMRFEEPEPRRIIGLAWRATSPRRRDFLELGRLVQRAFPPQRRSPEPTSHSQAGSLAADGGVRH
jgi:LysR family hydrogen peroxide-inducible transcriptional activator